MDQGRRTVKVQQPLRFVELVLRYPNGREAALDGDTAAQAKQRHTTNLGEDAVSGKPVADQVGLNRVFAIKELFHGRQCGSVVDASSN